jgi:hypothetical protein
MAATIYFVCTIKKTTEAGRGRKRVPKLQNAIATLSGIPGGEGACPL